VGGEAGEVGGGDQAVRAVDDEVSFAVGDGGNTSLRGGR
jgi:hypothetical protein